MMKGLVISPFCELLKMPLRVLTSMHCKNRQKPFCENGECQHFGMRFYYPTGGI
jgi:hypothetical protein